jgi:hypothetical protein
MSYDLAMMALEGLTRSPIDVRVENGTVSIEAAPEGFKDLARLCLILGGQNPVEGGFELRPELHVRGSLVRLQLKSV